MIDSWGHLNSGFLSGEHVNFGKYDQCIGIEYNLSGNSFKNTNNDNILTGKYCLYEVSFPLLKNETTRTKLKADYNDSCIINLLNDYDMFEYFPLTNSLCFPSSCSGIEMNVAMQNLLDSKQIPMQVKVHDKCVTAQDFVEPYSSYPIWKQVCGYILCTVVMTVLISTIMRQMNPQYMSDFMTAFDARENTRKLFHVPRSKDEERFMFIAGVRFVYFGIAYWTHINFSSSLATQETHGKESSEFGFY